MNRTRSAPNKVFSNLIQQFFRERPLKVEEENYPSYFCLNIASLLGFITHLGWLVVFFLLNVKPLFLFNFVSASMWLSSYFANRKGSHLLSFSLMATEVLLHQTLCVVVIGWSTGFQYWFFIIIIGVFIVPPGRSLLKIALAPCSFISYSVLHYFYSEAIPLIQLDPKIVSVMNYSNIIMYVSFTAIPLFYFASKMHETRGALSDEQSKVKEAYSLLSKYVAPQLVDTISDGNIEKIWKHNRKKLTLFFSDIKDFTRITDSMEPEDMGSLLNEYLTEMNVIINEYRGTLAQVIGDALYVFFGAPESSNEKEHAVKCVNMAIDMQRKMRDLNERWFNRGVDEILQTRCGVNTGMATVGGYGSSDRKEYTAMGMQVNIAARLEQACEPGGVLISHTTWALVRDEITCTEKGLLNAKGCHKPIRIYSVDAIAG